MTLIHPLLTEESSPWNILDFEGAAMPATLLAAVLTEKELALYSGTVITFLQRP